MGQTVKKGAKLGQVGQSGLAEFPHLHFSLRHNKTVIDPFTGKGVSGCGIASHGLWEHGILYDGVKIYAAGFSDKVLETSDISLNAESPQTLPAASPALVFWVSLYGLEAGDKIMMTVQSPDGKIFAQSDETAAKTKIRYFHYTGQKNNALLMPGIYRGIVTLARTLPDGSILTRKAAKSLTIR